MSTEREVCEACGDVDPDDRERHESCKALLSAEVEIDRLRTALEKAEARIVAWLRTDESWGQWPIADVAAASALADAIERGDHRTEGLK